MPTNGVGTGPRSHDAESEVDREICAQTRHGLQIRRSRQASNPEPSQSPSATPGSMAKVAEPTVVIH